jgi:hypothetical protein
VPVQAQFGSPRRIAAHFDEQRAEVGIVDVEVAVIHINGLVARELEPTVDLLALESLGFLLGYTDEDDRARYAVAETGWPSSLRSLWAN